MKRRSNTNVSKNAKYATVLAVRKAQHIANASPVEEEGPFHTKKHGGMKTNLAINALDSGKII